MNKKLFLLGVVTMGLLLLGSLPAVAPEPDPVGSDPFGDLNGAVDLSYDLSLTHVGTPQSSTPTGLTNTNLRYNLTSMKSPLDQFFNVGAFMFGGPDTGPMPEFMVNGTFEGSELFVKIVNDQYSVTDPNNRLIDIEVLIPAEANLEGVPIDLLPTTVSIPAGSGIPPLPVIQSTTNFSYFEDLGNLAQSYGYDGLPFVSPAIVYVEDIAQANDYWTNFNVSKMFGDAEDPDDNRTIEVTTNFVASTYFELNVEASFFNTTAEFGNVSLNARWGNDGWLSTFNVALFADLDQSLTLDTEEEFFLQFDLIGHSKADIPIQVDDQGEYIINMDFSATLALDNVTEQDMAQGMLDEIILSINELDGEKLLNYTVDAMDGLYYHIDGYLLDLPRFMNDRLSFLSDSGTGAQTPQPIEDYYMPISGMDQGKDDFALNLFDAGVYRNTTRFLETYDGHYYWDDFYGYDVWASFQAIDENTTQIDRYMPGIVNAMIYEKSGWNWSLSIEENTAALTDVYNGPVNYTEQTNSWVQTEWNSTHWVDVWYYDTYNAIQIVDNSSPFLTGVDYVAVLEIESIPNSGFTSYKTMSSPYMMMFGDNNGPSEPVNAGFGAQEPPASQTEMSLFGLAMPDPQSLLPLPARTPDWEQVGGPMVFLEGYVMQVADVITSPDFISFLEEMAVQDPGDSLDITYFDVGLDWMVNGTHAGAENWFELDMTMVDNDTGNMKVVTQSADITSYESYYWHSNGVFDVAEISVQMHVDASSVDWPSDETTTTTTVPPEETTTTETTLELTPGFEVVFAIGSLIALPLFFKKRR
ncbi:MAG: hypothetical protein ACXACY_11920 [Candidatus Hodarchaeales archaeon]|jgi:hypothetical protein